MSVVPGNWHYPKELPVVEHREEILAALKQHQVVVVVSDTGSGKTTQLPKMVAEALGSAAGRIGCTQPRRIAASSVATRVAEELRVPLGNLVGYQVRFEDKTSKETRIKFMTDGILLAESQGDPMLKQYSALILDEAHERSLNIDFLLGYLKQVLAKRQDLKLVISSATLDAGSFATFFGSENHPAPVIEAPGRMFPVEEVFLAPKEDEELAQQVVRGMEELSRMGAQGDVLVFVPGEREIRECANAMEAQKYPGTDILPLFARLSLGDQQKVFNPGRNRRVILATNVAETSLTIPRIRCVIDSGLARVSRWAPGRGVERLLIEPISQASARQRKGRCGRIAEGTCLRLYEKEDLQERSEFTDPEIRRSSLAGVILRMKTLGLENIEDFPFLAPPSPKAISEGYRTLREVGALTKSKDLTDLGRSMSRLPLDPRLARMLIEAQKEKCLTELLPIIAALESSDPRERPADKAAEADKAQELWKDVDSDFIGMLRMWRDLQQFRVKRGNWQANQLRKFCKKHYLNFRRVREWGNIIEELSDLLVREWDLKLQPLSKKGEFDYDSIHRCLIAGVPRQFGVWDHENKSYRSASGGFFSVFPGSGLFGLKKRHEWLVAMELVETNKLWARRVARIDPEWIEQVVPHLCQSKYGEAHWDIKQGAVYGKQRVVCGALPIVVGRRIHYGRVDKRVAHAVFLREGLLAGRMRRQCDFLDQLQQLREEVEALEHKLRRPGGLWHEEWVLEFLDERIPQEVHTESAFHNWLEEHEQELCLTLDDVLQEDLAGLNDYPDALHHDGQQYTLYYNAQPGERDEGVTIGVHVDQLPQMPEWLPGWGVDGDLQERTELLIRSLSKDFRKKCQPVKEMVDEFVFRWCAAPKVMPIEQAIAELAMERHQVMIPHEMFSTKRFPEYLISKIWVCDDDGEQLAMGTDVALLKLKLADHMKERFEAVANLDVEQSGMSAWDGESLPEVVETPGGDVYPALVDEGATVGIRSYLSYVEAEQSHRTGGARLLCLMHPDQVKYLEKKFPLDVMTRASLSHLGKGGTSMDDLILLAAEGAAGVFPKSPQAFRQLSERVRSEWHVAALKIADAILQINDRLPVIREWIAKHHGERHLGAVADDLDEQLAWLFRGRFAWLAGYRRLLEYPWYLQAIQTRIGRIESLPIARDLEKMKRLRDHWEAWFAKWNSKPESPTWWSHGWELEDWRAVFFAPDMRCPRKTSEKRVIESWEELLKQS